MKIALFLLMTLCLSTARADPAEISIPETDIALLKTTDAVEVTGTNQHGQPEDFTIHNAKAISQFIAFLTDARYIAVPKNLKPTFKSLSTYQVHFFSNGQPIFALHLIADDVLDIPNDANYYMQSDRHSDILLAPLLRLR